MKIVYIGCVETSAVFLKTLLETKANVVGIITKSESRENADFVDLGSIADEYGIDKFYAQDINDTESINFVKKRSPDVIFCMGWSRLLKKEILTIPKMGVVGFHPAKIPYNRGRHPLIWALVLGLEKTASTFFLMDQGADTGKIVSQEDIAIAYEDDARTLYDKILQMGSKQIKTIVAALENQTLHPLTQPTGVGNVWRKRGIKDGEIDWRMSSRAIYNLVRGLTRPYVGAHFVKDGAQYKVWKVKENYLFNEDNIEPGKVLKVFSPSHYIIKVSDHAVEVLESEAIMLTESSYL